MSRETERAKDANNKQRCVLFLVTRLKNDGLEQSRHEGSTSRLNRFSNVSM